MKLSLKETARELRLSGYLQSEIARQLGVGRTTVTRWLKGVELSSDARKRIEDSLKPGQIAAAERRYELRRDNEEQLGEKVASVLSAVTLSPGHIKLVCALVYWCEGTKHDNRVAFTNSDPNLTKTFLALLRSGFQIDEAQFRIQMHLHEYHDSETQMRFWSSVSDIPVSQFSSPYIKPHTGKRYRDGYQGCVSVRYYDAALDRELKRMACVFLKQVSERGMIDFLRV